MTHRCVGPGMDTVPRPTGSENANRTLALATGSSARFSSPARRITSSGAAIRWNRVPVIHRARVVPALPWSADPIRYSRFRYATPCSPGSCRRTPSRLGSVPKSHGYWNASPAASGPRSQVEPPGLPARERQVQRGEPLPQAGDTLGLVRRQLERAPAGVEDEADDPAARRRDVWASAAGAGVEVARGADLDLLPLAVTQRLDLQRPGAHRDGLAADVD